MAVGCDLKISFASICAVSLKLVILRIGLVRYKAGQLWDHVATDEVTYLLKDVRVAIKKTVYEHAKAWKKLDTTEQTTLAEQAAVWATRHDGHRVKYPACRSIALVFGSPAGPSTRTIGEDHIVAWRVEACGTVNAVGYFRHGQRAHDDRDIADVRSDVLEYLRRGLVRSVGRDEHGGVED